MAVLLWPIFIKRMFMQKYVHNDGTGDEENLLRLLRQGERDAFTHIYECYHKMLYALACRYLKNRTAAEDAVQHVFIKLWEYRATITVTINLRNYLYTMTKNYILNYIRNENSAVAHNYRIAQMADAFEDNLFETIERKELMAAFYQAIKLLPVQKREICLLKLEDKLSNQEIADIMQLSVNTVKTHYAQAIKLLRVSLNKMLQITAGWLILLSV
jgi:RNA polymerase sigma-70 factor (ECF subfamily)